MMNMKQGPLDALSNIATRKEGSIIMNCICRIEELLDDEIYLLEQGNFHDLDHNNLRKSHLLSEFSRLTCSYFDNSDQIHTQLAVCRSKATRNYEALGNYLRALEELNYMILDHLRSEESAGTYSRSVAMKSSGC